MNRRELMIFSGLLGLGGNGKAWSNTPEKSVNSVELPVLIIGAGAAGMAAGYLLAQKGIDFHILEASSTYGGRMKRMSDFADFPISLGAEWLHTSKRELDFIVNDEMVSIATAMNGYTPLDRVGFYKDGKLTYHTLGEAFGPLPDLKFRDSSWLDFFDRYIVAKIRKKMQFNTEVLNVDYSGSMVCVTDSEGREYRSSKLLVTVPIQILRDNDIVFSPSLPEPHLRVLRNAPIWGGFKAFMRFSERFFPTFLMFSDSETTSGQRLYYDAGYGQKSDQHILGLFAVGKQAEPYQRLVSQNRPNYLLRELDAIFNDAASRTLMKHHIQDWNKEPFIRSAYLADTADSNISRTLAQSIDDKIYFAGDAYTREDDWGGVHNATRSAREAVIELSA